MLQRNVFKKSLYISIMIFAVPTFVSHAEEKVKMCTECHDPEVSHAINAMLSSAHWSKNNASSPVSKKGCQSCHGVSNAHTSTPTKIQPQISFGPRWTSSISQQNETCLSCHEKTTTHEQWRSGKHAEQDVTCVTCHDVHVEHDKVRNSDTQAQVCTVCHKVQKSGMHHIADKMPQNPQCSTCHNPHANPSPTVMMLENRSEGCRSCHDLSKMQASTVVSAKAKSYHRVMQKDDRTCVDCHLGVAHVDKDNFGKLLAGGLVSMPLDLFYPGKSDGDWLLQEHQGAQALRQGRNCRQCHLGDAKAMGNSLAPSGVTSSIAANVSVKKVNDNMEITVQWQGSINDNSVAIMFDNGMVDDFSQQGCWASCHSDLPGMTRDRQQGLTKYLLTSQKQKRSIGTPSILHDENTLAGMHSEGRFVELWRANLSDGALDSIKRSSVLSTRKEQALGKLKANANFNNGQWEVTFIKPINDKVKPILLEKQITFGIAIHGDGESAAQHKVSLPLTISIDGSDTDFILK